MRTFENVEAMEATVGQELGTSPWTEVTQEQVNLFADATGDHQWIHVDPERAAAGPFGAPIAHGFLTLSLLPKFMEETYTVDNIALAVNYGLGKARFITPVKVGARVRATFALVGAERIDMGVRTTVSATVEIEGSERPALVAEMIAVLVPA
jgi:acyl dehydratase